jgi:hypothetical protein
MIDGLEPGDYLDWNYDFFRIHRVIPALGSRSKREDYKLSDLRVAALQNNPEFGRSVLATLLVRMYDSLWIDIPSPKNMLTRPGEKTMKHLAGFCHEKARRKHPEGLAEN